MNRRVRLLAIITVLVGGVFSSRLFYIQVFKEEYKLKSSSISRRSVTLYPGRGYIYDRNNRLFVANRIIYDLMVIPSKVGGIDTTTFCKLLDISKHSFIERMGKARKYSRYKASLFLGEISKENYAYFQEFSFKYKGFYIQRKSTREYPYSTGANVLGYIGEVTPKQVKALKYYEKGDMIGVAGIEKSYEEYLRGSRGVKYLRVDALNRNKGPLENGDYDIMPKQGESITVSLDLELQKYGEKLLDGKRGAVVAIEPSSGEILALVSKPSFDPKLLIGRHRTRNYNTLLSNTKEKPLFDRSILGEYPPGSPFKIITGLIGLQEKVFTPEKIYYCDHGFYSGRRLIACHCGSRKSNLLKAIARSCNSYFSSVYRGIMEKTENISVNFETWYRHVKSFGLGKYLGNDLPTGRKGFIPDTNYYDKVYGKGRWKASYHISNAFGQGEISVTPLQLANVAAIIANRGFYYIPHIIKKIGRNTPPPKKFRTRYYSSVDSSHFGVVIEGMQQVFQPKGTAAYLALSDIEVCGKTGTSQNPHGQDHSVFMAFAPKKNPKIAISVIIENGYWGARWAAPIASLMIERYLQKNISRNRFWIEKRMLEGRIDYSEESKNQGFDGEVQ